MFVYTLFHDPIVPQANKYEQVLARRAQGISQNLHQALETHNRYANDDITTALIEHARSSIMYERQLLRELEALRVDVSNAANKYVAPANGVSKPPAIPPLEEASKPTPSRITPSVAPPNGTHTTAPGTQLPPPRIETPHRAPFQSYSQSLAGPLGNPLSPGPPSASSTQGIYDRREPLTPSSTQSSFGPTHPTPSPSVSASNSFARQPLPQSPGPQSPGAGPSSPSAQQQTTPRPPINEPPLGGRLVEGSKSMFVKPPTTIVPPSPLQSSSIASPLTDSPSTPLNKQSHAVDPLLGVGTGTLSRAVSSPLLDSPLHGGPNGTRSTNANGHGPLHNGLDPLGQVQPVVMSATVRAPPQRPRLDAREAAKSLANMF
jgi:hypothetical protein